MVSTDGAPDDEDGGEEPIEESVLPPGPRRSTYTPPVGKSAADPAAVGSADDALADALAASLANATGAINVIYQLDDVAPSVPEGVPVEQLPASPAGSRIRLADEGGSGPAMPAAFDATAMPSPTPTSVPADLPPPPGEKSGPVFDLTGEDAGPVAAAPSAASAPVVDLPAAEPSAAEPAAETPLAGPPAPEFPAPEFPAPESPAPPPPVFDLPVFDPPAFEPPVERPFDEAAALAAASAPTGGQRWLPERRSLRDDELASLLEAATSNPSGTLGAMEEFERQLKLREEETREFQEWQQTMIAVGTPEALAAVEQMRPEFNDMAAGAHAASPQPPTAPLPSAGVDSAGAPPVAPPPVMPAAPPPAMPVAPPPAFNAPPPAMPPAAPPTAAAPPTMPPPPTAPGNLSAPPPPFTAPPPLVEPPSIPDAWDIPPGNVIPGSETEFDGPMTPPPLVDPGAYAAEPFGDRVTTGSIPIPPHRLDVENDVDNPVDATDQVPVYDSRTGGTSFATAPVDPILSPRIPDDEVVLGEEQQLERPRVFSLEQAGLEPTPEEQRVGRAARMFWMWFAANSSIVSIGFGALVFSLGMSLRQAVVGIVAGVAASFLPLGLGTLASKRSGQPTMVVSRAVFGVVGNGIPALIAVLSRVFWGAALLWLLGRGSAAILEGAQLTGGLSTESLTLAGMAVGLVLAIVIALFGYGLIAVFQLVVTVVSVILVAGLIGLTYGYVDIPAALTFRDGSWLLALTAAVLVFSFVGLLWANSSGDLARYQGRGSSGGGAMLWATFGTAIPSFALISYGALLAASNTQIAAGLLANPLDTLGLLLPVWYPAPLLAATGLSLISGVVVVIYSGGFAVKALGVSFSRSTSVVVVGLLVAAGAFLIANVGGDLATVFRDLATTLAVPVAAWAGIFAADTMIRNRRYHSDSLLRRGGIYPSANWVNLLALLVVTAIGFGLTTASIAGLQWQGYLFSAAGVPLDGTLAGTDLGVFAALLLGLLVPIVTGVPGIRRQEATEPPR